MILLLLALVGCGPNCQSTCFKLYGTDIEDCAIERPGRGSSVLIDDCLAYCDEALSVNGELGDYDPFTKKGSDVAITLDNERQAALWMECVNETACERIEEGYCAPVW